MALMDEPVWRGQIYSGGGIGASGTGAGFGGAASLDTRWVTVRGDIAPYPF
jgi:hypothetical protein